MWLIRTRYRFKKPQIGNYPAIDYASVEKSFLHLDNNQFNISTHLLKIKYAINFNYYPRIQC